MTVDGVSLPLFQFSRDRRTASLTWVVSRKLFPRMVVFTDYITMPQVRKVASGPQAKGISLSDHVCLSVAAPLVNSDRHTREGSAAQPCTGCSVLLSAISRIMECWNEELKKLRKKERKKRRKKKKEK